MDTNDGLKRYYLSPEELESMLQTHYGSKIEPVDHGKLQQLRRQQQQRAAMNLFSKDNHVKMTAEPE